VNKPEYGTAILSCPSAALKPSRQCDVKADISNRRRYTIDRSNTSCKQR